jgi:hypothetical protein
MSASFGYDNLGRLNQVTADYKERPERTGMSVSSAYSYIANGSSWETMTQGSFTSVRVPEPARDVLWSITSSHVTKGTLARFGYGTDNAGRREWATQAGMAFQDFVDSANDATYYRFAYNAASELERATGYRGTSPSLETSPLPGRGFTFTYDQAGNRRTAGISGETVSYWDATNGSGSVGANALNQPQSRGTLRTRASGTTDKTAHVSVDNVPASREADPGR